MEDKKPPPFIMTRTCFCTACFEAGRPEEGKPYVVFAGTRQELRIRKSSAVPKKHLGFTPHIIVFQEVCLDAPYIGYIKALVSCGVCGFDLQRVDDGDEPEFDVYCKKSHVVYYEPAEWAALKKWKDTGYELS